MGAILRLDGRCEVEEQDVDRAGVVTSSWGEPKDKSGTGRIWPIRSHDKPELRLKAWTKGRELRVDASDVVIGHGGTLDYFELAPGCFEADTAHGGRGLGRSVVFRVREGYRIEVISRAARTPDGTDLVVAQLSGWSLDRLRREREAYAADLAAKAEAEGLPPLVGSPRAVAKANEFRRTKLAHALEYVTAQFEAAKAIGDPDDEGGQGLAVMWLNAALKYMAGIDDAGWWMAHIDRPGAKLVRGLAVAGYRGEVELVTSDGRAVG